VLILTKWTPKKIEKEISYRVPRLTTHFIRNENCGLYGISDYMLCPTCECVIERDYQAFCDACGQKLKWGSWKKVVLKEYSPSK
jgi:hypothetical protein